MTARETLDALNAARAFLAHLDSLGPVPEAGDYDGLGWNIDGAGDHELRQAHLRELVAALEATLPAGRPTVDLNPDQLLEYSLLAAVSAATAADVAIHTAAARCRQHRWSYNRIGKVLGVSRQAAWERFKAAHGEEVPS